MADAAATAGTGVLAQRMAEAAGRLLAALGPEQRAKAAIPFADDEERRRWYYTPNERGGLPLAEMDPLQQQLTHRLIVTGLSDAGYATAATIMGLENTLDARENWRFGGYPGRAEPSRGRDPNMYFVSVFGAPGDNAPWGWRFGGHHVSLQYTIVGGREVAHAPAFLGANPAEVELLGGLPLRPLASCEDAARDLLRSLDAEQHAIAVISPAAPPDIVQSNRPQVEEGALPVLAASMMRRQLTPEQQAAATRADARFAAALGFGADQEAALRYQRTPQGLPGRGMTERQQDLLRTLLHQYIDRMPAELVAQESAKIEATLPEIHFAWAGGCEHRQPHYYRLQGPRLLVEYDCTQNDANHIHSVWRDPEGDFGADLLAEHYAAAH